MRFTFSLLGTEIVAIEFAKSESITLDELIAAGSGEVESVGETDDAEEVTLSYGFASGGEITCTAEKPC